MHRRERSRPHLRHPRLWNRLEHPIPLHDQPRAGCGPSFPRVPDGSDGTPNDRHLSPSAPVASPTAGCRMGRIAAAAQIAWFRSGVIAQAVGYITIMPTQSHRTPPARLAARVTDGQSQTEPVDDRGPLGRLPDDRRQRVPRPARPALHRTRHLRGVSRRRLDAEQRRLLRPDPVRRDRTHGRGGPVRAGARPEVRDVRGHPHPRRDHRRAARPGLGAPLGAEEGS